MGEETPAARPAGGTPRRSRAWRGLTCVYNANDPRASSLHKVVKPVDIVEKIGLAYPHISHCLASGDIMVSCLGDGELNAKGNGFFTLILKSESRNKKPRSSRIYVVDIAKDPGAPFVELVDISEKNGLAYSHTSRCLAAGDIMVSCLRDGEGNAKGDVFFILTLKSESRNKKPR